MVVHSWSDRQPGQLLLWRKAAPAGARWQLISSQQPGIEPKQMATLDLVRIKARDGRDLPVWLTKPADAQPGQPRPALLLVHGGPWVRHGHWRWDPMAQFLASRGYLVIEPEFRGSDGYGAAHLQAGNKQWGQAMQDDVADALLRAQKQGLASDQACILGGSYGGYCTLLGRGLFSPMEATRKWLAGWQARRAANAQAGRLGKPCNDGCRPASPFPSGLPSERAPTSLRSSLGPTAPVSLRA
ncbi:MAG: alpha/beta fold hydrolase [Inhella sp.]